jgi:hypothetical protein
MILKASLKRFSNPNTWIKIAATTMLYKKEMRDKWVIWSLIVWWSWRLWRLEDGEDLTCLEKLGIKDFWVCLRGHWCALKTTKDHMWDTYNVAWVEKIKWMMYKCKKKDMIKENKNDWYMYEGIEAWVKTINMNNARWNTNK